jgi:hypothetical protein
LAYFNKIWAFAKKRIWKKSKRVRQEKSILKSKDPLARRGDLSSSGSKQEKNQLVKL